MSGDGIALFYLARGADADHLASIRRFVRSLSEPACWRGPRACCDLQGICVRARPGCRQESAMAGIAFQEVHTGDETFDFGAYADAIMRCDLRARRVSEHRQ